MKDLVDIVLVVESGLLDPNLLGAAISAVFAERVTEIPSHLPAPPGDWVPTYAAMARETGIQVVAFDAAWRIAADQFDRTRAPKGPA